MGDAIDIRRGAEISLCGRYRYSLDRKWFDDTRTQSSVRHGTHLPIIFVMLNPSTADAYEDDPTIRRCIGFAKREGFEWLNVINLFAGRATKPADLLEMSDPVGPENFRKWLLAYDLSQLGAKIVCAWGAQPEAADRGRDFLDVMQAGNTKLWCLGTTKHGHPKHPLYIKGDQPLLPFNTTAEGRDNG